MSDLEKEWRRCHVAVDESSCPVCRINTYIARIPVLFGYGVEEPSNIITDYEYVFTSDGRLCYDYKGNLEVKNKPIIHKTYYGCGASYGFGCGAGGCWRG